MTYQYESQLTEKAKEYIEKLAQAGITANIISGSMRDYSLKISVSKAKQPAQNVVLHYSPRKDQFSLTYNEMKDRTLEPELEAVWQGDSQLAGSENLTDSGVELYVDGSFQTDTNMIGYGVVIVQNGKKLEELSGPVPTEDDPSLLQSHQVAGEIYSVRAGITWCRDQGLTDVTVVYDYKGLEYWATGKWETNKPLTRAYVEFIQDCGVKIIWRKVAAHTGQRWNERADALAKKAVSPQPTTNAIDPLSLAIAKAEAFVEFLQNEDITAVFDDVYNNQYVRIIIYEQAQKIGVCDLYNTKKRPLSKPSWHNCKPPAKQQEFEALWNEFYNGDNSPTTTEPAIPLTSSDVDYYYQILKPYANCDFDFIDLAQAITRAAKNQSIRLASFDPEQVRYKFRVLEAAYNTIKGKNNV